MKKLLFVMVLALGVVALMAPPAMAQDEKPFTLHGEARFRGDYNSNTDDFSDDSGDGGSFWPYRVRIAAEGHFTKNITAWIEFQNAGVMGNDFPVRTGSDEINDSGISAEMYQGNITIDGLWWKDFSVRIGRQEIVAGTELLLGDLDFYAGLSHDGFSGNYKLKKGNIMLFYTRVVEGNVDTLDAAFLPPGAFTLNSGSADTTNFFGVYTTWNIPLNSTLDAYVLNLKAHGSNVGSAGDFDVMTLGARWSKDVANKNGLFWNIEHAMQSGDADTNLDANGSVTEGWIGWNFKAGKNNHRVYVKLEAASGDDNALDTDEDGFIPLFGDFHNRVGHGDWFFLAGDPTGLGGVGDLGLAAVAAGWTGRFGDQHELGAELWKISSAEDNAAGEDSLGSEIDVFYNFNYSKNLTFSANLSRLSPDDGLTGGLGAPDDTVSRMYGNARFRF